MDSCQQKFKVASVIYWLVHDRVALMALHPTTLAHLPTSEFSHLPCFPVILFPSSVTKAKFITCSLPLLFSCFLNGYLMLFIEVFYAKEDF